MSYNRNQCRAKLFHKTEHDMDNLTDLKFFIALVLCKFFQYSVDMNSRSIRGTIILSRVCYKIYPLLNFYGASFDSSWFSYSSSSRLQDVNVSLSS